MTGNPTPVLLIGVTDSVSFRLLEGQVDHFLKEGWDTHLVAGGVRSPSFESAPVHHIEMARRPDVWRDARALIAWVGLLNRLRPAVMMVGTPKAGLLGGLAGWLARIPRRIYLVRGLRLETEQGIFRAVLWLMERVTIAAATDVVAVSHSLAQSLVESRLAPASRVRVLGSGSSNGIDINRNIGNETEPTRPPATISQRTLVVGFVGRLHPDKGLHLLVRALAEPSRIEGVEVVVVGRSEDNDYVADLRRLSQTTHLPVRFVGEATDMPAAYAQMDLLCLPSLREGFPNVVLEAAASGRPSIVSSATGCRDAVVDGVTGWTFATGDVLELRTILEAIVAAPETVPVRGRQARVWVGENFARGVVWKHYDDLLSEGLGAHPVVGTPR